MIKSNDGFRVSVQTLTLTLDGFLGFKNTKKNEIKTHLLSFIDQIQQMVPLKIGTKEF